MGQPLSLTYNMAKYVVKERLKGNKRIPMVMFLEPTEMCNLTCTGCGKIRQSPEVLNKRLTAQDCFDAIDECGAPAVSIAGGEPLTHPEIGEIVQGMLDRGKLTLLCSNGILLHRAFQKLKPDPKFTFVLHLDGPREHHDRMVERKGVYDIVIKGIQEAKRLGFRVSTNTTLYKGADPEATGRMLAEITELGVDNCVVSPAFTYEEVDTANSGIYLHRKEAIEMLQRVFKAAGPNVKYYNTPMFLDFLQGKKQLKCKPWGTPTRDPKGWKGPCYLLTDGHYETFGEMMKETEWEEFGYGENPRCASCMVDSGYEVSAIDAMTPLDYWRMVRWIFAG